MTSAVGVSVFFASSDFCTSLVTVKSNAEESISSFLDDLSEDFYSVTSLSYSGFLSSLVTPSTLFSCFVGSSFGDSTLAGSTTFGASTFVITSSFVDSSVADFSSGDVSVFVSVFVSSAYFSYVASYFLSAATSTFLSSFVSSAFLSSTRAGVSDLTWSSAAGA